MGFSTGGTCMSGCFSWRTSTTSRPVFVQTSLERRHTFPISVGGLSDRLPQLSQQQGAVETMHQAILLLFNTSLNTSLSSSAICQHIPHQACVYTPLPEVKLAVDPCPDLPVLASAKCLSQYHMGKDEGYLGIPLSAEHSLSLSIQDCSKPAPHLLWGRGVLAS